MKALLLLLVLVLVAATAPGLDTPLVLAPPSGQSTNAVIINPALGTAIVYEVTSSNSTKQSECNWLFDLDYHDKMVLQEQNGIAYSYLRVGLTNVVAKAMLFNPTPEELLSAIPDKLTRSQLDRLGDKTINPRALARAAEDKFWAKDRPYDGKVAAAFDGQYLFIVIPAKHAVMVYELAGQVLELRALKGYGPELLVPQGLNTSPRPADVFKALPKAKQDEMLKQMDTKLVSVPDETPVSEVWCAAAGGSTFILVDTANKRLISYLITGRRIETCVRDLQFDLLYEGWWQSRPDGPTLVQTFQKAHQARLVELGYPEITLDLMKAWVGQNAVGDAAKAGALQANLQGRNLILDFTGERKLMTFACRGQTLDLTAIRDTTVDAAIALFIKELNANAVASGVLSSVEQRVKSLQPKVALNQVRFALELNPFLFKALEKPGSAIKATLQKALPQDWEEMIANAQKKAEETDAKRKAAIEEIEKAKRRPAN